MFARRLTADGRHQIVEPLHHHGQHIIEGDDAYELVEGVDHRQPPNALLSYAPGGPEDIVPTRCSRISMAAVWMLVEGSTITTSGVQISITSIRTSSGVPAAAVPMARVLHANQVEVPMVFVLLSLFAAAQDAIEPVPPAVAVGPVHFVARAERIAVPELELSHCLAPPPAASFRAEPDDGRLLLTFAVRGGKASLSTRVTSEHARMYHTLWFDRALTDFPWPARKGRVEVELVPQPPAE